MLQCTPSSCTPNHVYRSFVRISTQWDENQNFSGWVTAHHSLPPTRLVSLKKKKRKFKNKQSSSRLPQEPPQTQKAQARAKRSTQ